MLMDIGKGWIKISHYQSTSTCRSILVCPSQLLDPNPVHISVIHASMQSNRLVARPLLPGIHCHTQHQSMYLWCCLQWYPRKLHLDALHLPSKALGQWNPGEAIHCSIGGPVSTRPHNSGIKSIIDHHTMISVQIPAIDGDDCEVPSIATALMSGYALPDPAGNVQPRS